MLFLWLIKSSWSSYYSFLRSWIIFSAISSIYLAKLFLISSINADKFWPFVCSGKVLTALEIVYFFNLENSLLKSSFSLWSSLICSLYFYAVKDYFISLSKFLLSISFYESCLEENFQIGALSWTLFPFFLFYAYSLHICFISIILGNGWEFWFCLIGLFELCWTYLSN